MTSEYHRASVKHLVSTNVLVYARAFLCVRDIDQVKITMCVDNYTYVHVCFCDLKQVLFVVVAVFCCY